MNTHVLFPIHSYGPLRRRKMNLSNKEKYKLKEEEYLEIVDYAVDLYSFSEDDAIICEMKPN